MTTTPKMGLTDLVEGQSGAETVVNANMRLLEPLLRGVKDRDLTAPPGSEAEGDAYIVGASATGDWSGKDGQITIYASGYSYIVPKEGMRVWCDDEDVLLHYDGSAWRDHRPRKVATGITASATQTQGEQPLTAEVNEITTCATTGDVVTLPATVAGRRCRVVNNGANSAQVFPPSGSLINGGSTDAAVNVAAGASADFEAVSSTRWVS